MQIHMCINIETFTSDYLGQISLNTRLQVVQNLHTRSKVISHNSHFKKGTSRNKSATTNYSYLGITWFKEQLGYLYCKKIIA